MDIEKCNHRKDENNICMDCGLCLDSCLFQSTWTQISTKSLPRPHLKYCLDNNKSIIEKAINNLLIPLGIQSYKSQIESLLSCTTFTLRLKLEDKIIVILYHLLKQHAFPIALPDLLKYTSLSKYRILKAHRDTFKYERNNDEYLLGIFERTVSFIEKYDINITSNFGEYLVYQRKFISSEPKSFCLAFLLEKNKIKMSKLKNIEEYNIFQINFIRAKLKKLKMN